MPHMMQAAHEAARSLATATSRDHQRALGQFFTPPAIAEFMAARLAVDLTAEQVRILEPAAGTGVLIAALVEAIMARPQRPKRIEIWAFEIDRRLEAPLRATLDRCREACEREGIAFDTLLRCEDFLLSDLAMQGQPLEGLLVIANPPFLKLPKSDLRAKAHAYAVHGQPNVYGLFMAATARLMGRDGRWCFITPRSWAAGTYFAAVRRTLLERLDFEALHSFESRTDGFEADAVLQETMIAWARSRQRAPQGGQIVLTRSQGVADLAHVPTESHDISRVFSQDATATLVLPPTASGTEALPGGWTATLSTHGLAVSTGPVVAFRATDFVCESARTDTVPLLWLQHVQQQRVAWPLQKKREHVRAVAASAWMLLANRPMVIMRRFSPKEDERRVTCAAYLGHLPGRLLGLENHLNYIHRPGGTLTADEARGLSAFLASRIADSYFRSVAGSTQVNATDLRRMPLPSLEAIVALGRRVGDRPTLTEVDEAVEAVLHQQPEQTAA